MSLIQAVQIYLPGFAVNVLRLTLWLVILGAIFLPMERLFAVQATKEGTVRRIQDVAYFFLSSLLPALALSGPLSLLAIGLHYLIPPAVLATVGALPWFVKIGLVFVVGEIGFYWGHRLCHEVPWLWRFHAIHHGPEHLYFLANTRAHPIDLIVTRLFGIVPLYVLGLAGPSVVESIAPVSLILIGTLWGFFIHANLRVRLGPLGRLISTPLFHHWHHSRIVAVNRNYASMLPALDYLFGTLHLPNEWPSSYGTEAPLSPTLTGQLIDPFRVRICERRSRAFDKT